MGSVYDILNWMTKDSLFTHQLPRAVRECAPWLFRWFPELATVDEIDLARMDSAIEELGAEKGVERWLGDVQRLRGLRDCYEVPRIPADDHERKDPYDELVTMRGTDEGIIILGNHP